MIIKLAFRCILLFSFLVIFLGENARCLEHIEIETFGDRQIVQMLEDRPEMRHAIVETHPVFTLVEDSFNGKYAGRRVYWSNEFPLKGILSYSVPARTRLDLPYVTVTSDTELCTPLDKWVCLVYELNNLLNYQDFNALSTRRAELSEEDFIYEFRKIEYRAYVKTHNWLAANPLTETVDEKSKLVRYVSENVSLEEFVSHEGGKAFLSKVYKGLAQSP